MAKINIKGIPQLKENIKGLFNEVIKDPDLLTDMAVKSLEFTQAMNRSGKSPSGKKHPALSSEWIDRKEVLSLLNNTSDFYRKGASNVTFTGRLIRSLKFKIFANKATIEINATGEHTGYKQGNGKRTKTISNEKLVDYLKDQGRNIFGINKQLQNILNKVVRSYLNKRIRSKFNLK